jgi:protein-S-isoprenylcysteine O-methyltransferase Ste14
MDGVIKFGNFLFKWRSYLPILFLFLAWKVFITPEYFERDHPIFQIFYEGLCFWLSAIGIGIRFIIAGYTPKGTSGRNTRSQKAHTLNTSGFYSLLRHPIYFLGNLPIFLGWLLFTEIWWLIFLGIFTFFGYYWFIVKAEDAFLKAKFGADWENWARVTPAFYPALWKKWVPFNTNFNLKKALKNEIPTLFMMILVFALVDTLRDLIIEKELDLFWLSVALLDVGFYLPYKIYLKKALK